MKSVMNEFDIHQTMDEPSNGYVFEDWRPRQNALTDDQWWLMILKSVGEGVVVTSIDGGIVFMNAVAEKLTGWRMADAVGQNLEEVFCIVDEHTRKRMTSPVERVLNEGGTIELLGQPILIARDGTETPVDDSAAAVRNSRGHMIGVVLVFRDVTNRRHEETAMAHQALHDTLTGLPNRALFMNRLEHSLARAQRHSEHWSAVLYIDLDRFKVINDSLGHSVGDQLLIKIGQRIVDCLRPEDTVARMGGDEFTVLLESFENSEYACEIADRILKAITQPMELMGHGVTITASIGIFMVSPHEQDAYDCLRDADTALYRAKDLGKNQWVLFDLSMRINALGRLQLEQQMRLAIHRQEFVLYYQPIISFQDGTLTGFEALVRWNHPERGLLGPDDFIPLAEETGLIVPIGWMMLREACRQAKAWEIAFPSEPKRTMSVNLSAIQFCQSDLVEQIRTALAETGLDGKSLKLEITESSLMETSESALTMLRALKFLDVKLIIDDFGIGYSSLHCLSKLPIDSLKVNHALTHQMDLHGHGEVIVRAVIAMAHTLKMEVTAEDIETHEQWHRIMSLGCDHGQGFLFAKPLTAHDAGALIAKPPKHFKEACIYKKVKHPVLVTGFE